MPAAPGPRESFRALHTTLTTHQNLLVALLPTVMEERFELLDAVLDALQVTREAVSSLGNGSTAAPATGSAPDDWRDAISAATRRVLLRYEKPLKHTTPAQQAEYIRKLRDGLAAIEARP